MTTGVTILPLRTLHYIQQTYPPAKFEAALLHLFQKFWAPPNENLTVPDTLRQALAEVPDPAEGKEKKLFTENEVEKIMQAAQTKPVKDLLTQTTQEALDRGAFGAPWIWAVNDQGKGEPFFGSDRFHFLYKFLGVPYREVELLPAPAKGSKL